MESITTQTVIIQHYGRKLANYEKLEVGDAHKQGSYWENGRCLLGGK